jgi:Zn-dependent peptidase ImmA (M78 family)/transcriptional regulator with XRE-family HTH domain
MEIAHKLKEARNRLALTLEIVSERSGIGTSAISNFENSIREPKLVQLQKLAKIYQRSVGFFLDDNTSPIECVLWRERPESPNAEELQAKLINLAEKFHSLEILCEEHSPYELPTATGTAETFSYPKAESLAFQVRKELGLGDRPGQTLLRVLEEVCNIKVFHLPFEPTGSAACSVSQEFGAAILLNSQNVRWRRNFDLAHELFHLLTWKVFRHDSAELAQVASEQEEKYATCFARNLLMPSEAFKEAINVQRDDAGKIGFDGLFEVAREFDVSVEAILWHMSFIFNLDGEKIKEYIDRVKYSLSTWDTRESDSPSMYPTRFVALCNQAFRKGLISTGRYAECLGISRRQAMKHLEQDAVEDVEVEFAHS